LFRSCCETLESRVFLSSVTLTATANAYVADASPSTNFGGSSQLLVESGPSGSNDITYVKFNLSGVSIINSATLQLTGALSNGSDSSIAVAADAVSDSTWTEGAITYNNAPTVGGSQDTATVNSTNAALYTWNVTSYLQAALQANDTVVSLALVAGGSSNGPVDFTSTEGGTGPQLVIDDTPPPAPTATVQSTNTISTANGQEKVIIAYIGSANINTGSISSSNLSVSSGPDGTPGVANNVTTSGSGESVTATYTINPPQGSTWSSGEDGNYTVTLLTNQVDDVNNQYAASTQGSFAVNLPVPDTTPPVANINTPSDISSAGNGNETVTVVYTDNVAVSAGTIAASSLSITGAAGTLHASTVSLSPNSNASTITATYTVHAPSGGWTVNDDGNYTVNLAAGGADDTSGNPSGATSSHFDVNIADNTPPVASIDTPSDISSAGNSNETVTVVYTDNVAVSAGTIAASSLSISGAAGTLQASNVNLSPNSNASTITATYTVHAPSGGWTVNDDGNYTVNLAAGGADDTSGNPSGATSSHFNVNIADSTPPVANINTPADIDTAGNAAETVKVVYTDNVAVSAGTIAASSLSITGAAGTLHASSVALSPNSDSATVTATYTINAPVGGWTTDDDGNYNVNLAAGGADDTSGNPSGAASSSFNVAIPDTTPPVASSVSASNITIATGNTQTVTVVYSDNVAVKQSSISTSDITVTGPGGIGNLSVTHVSTTPTINSSLITATYTVSAPGGTTWDFADNGTYMITVNAGSVQDTSNNGVASRTGSFMVQVPQPDTTPPTDQITAPDVTVTGATESITVVYADNVAVDASTIDDTSLTVTGDGNTLQLTNLSKLPATNAPTITAVYTFSAPGGAWSAADNGTYTVTLPGNHVTDTSGNADTGDTAHFNVNLTVPDTTPPTAMINAPDVTAPGAASEAITIVYTDNVAVKAMTINTSNISVTGNGNTLNVSGVTTTGSGATITALYTVDAPGGAWAASANGTYTVTLNAGSVTDTSGNGVAGATSNFNVNATIPDTTPPTATIIAPTIADATTSPQTVSVIYVDAGNVDAATISTANLTVTGPTGAALTVASVSATPAGNAQTVTATYLVDPPSGGWTFAANGTYTVTLDANQVTDTSNNATPSASVNFVVKIHNPGDPNDVTFNGGNAVSTPFVAEASVTLSNGQIAIVGYQGSPTAGTAQGVIELLNSDGSQDMSFGSGGFVTTTAGSNEAFYSAVAQGNDIVVAGADGGFLLQRYTLAGTIDSTFGTAGSVVTNFGSTGEAAYSVTLSPDGTIVAGGTSAGNLAFARYSANGALDTTFAQGGLQLFDAGSSTDVVGQVLVQSDGRILAVCGSGSNVVVVRLTADGKADGSFGNGGLAIVPGLTTNPGDTGGDHSEGIALDPDGTIFVVNRTTSGHFGLVHLDSSGNLDTSFGANGLATANFGGDDDADAVFVQTGGQIIVSGTTDAGGTPLTAVAAFTQSGQLDGGFGTGGQATMPLSVGADELSANGQTVTSFASQTSSGLVVVGASNQTDSTIRRLVVPGTSFTATETFLGNFGKVGKKTVKYTFTESDGTVVTIALAGGGTGQAYMAANGLHLVVSGGKGAGITITAKKGSGRVTLGDVTVTGNLKTLSAKSADLGGTLFASGAIGTVTLGNVVDGDIAAAGTIGTLKLASLSGADILSGANLGADGELGGTGSDADTFAAGSIGTLTVGGAITTSVVAAGLDPVNGVLVGADDQLIGGKSSVIKSITAKSVDSGTLFIAGAFKTAKLPKKVNTATDKNFDLLS
jgi:uncharacterized delta-60 repeat protein